YGRDRRIDSHGRYLLKPRLQGHGAALEAGRKYDAWCGARTAYAPCEPAVLRRYREGASHRPGICPSVAQRHASGINCQPGVVDLRLQRIGAGKVPRGERKHQGIGASAGSLGNLRRADICTRITGVANERVADKLNIVGQPLPKVDAWAKVTGETLF